MFAGLIVALVGLALALTAALEIPRAIVGRDQAPRSGNQ